MARSTNHATGTWSPAGRLAADVAGILSRGQDRWPGLIDDASHIGTLTPAAFWHLFDHHLKPGGIYVIEDWGTGYWENWDDGASYDATMPGLLARFVKQDRNFSAHNFGMVGFIKELVDECGRSDITKPKRGTPPEQKTKIDEMIVRGGHAFVRKRLA